MMCLNEQEQWKLFLKKATHWQWTEDHLSDQYIFTKMSNHHGGEGVSFREHTLLIPSPSNFPGTHAFKLDNMQMPLLPNYMLSLGTYKHQGPSIQPLHWRNRTALLITSLFHLPSCCRQDPGFDSFTSRGLSSNEAAILMSVCRTELFCWKLCMGWGRRVFSSQDSGSKEKNCIL